MPSIQIGKNTATVGYLHVHVHPLTHKGSKVQCALLLPIHGLDVGSLDQEEGEHLKMAVVGGMVESRLTGTITDIQVTKMGDQDLCMYE